MIATIVHIWVKPEYRDNFIKACLKNAENSIKEPGNLRFDFIQDMEDPNKFVFYEAYKAESDVLAHKETAHYNEWRETVNDWMAKPRKGVKHQILGPSTLG
ncbi:putative quinol monooxygenase [Flexithrix dorotheae]|uniref:putative quinol monooxygenase n=1 Tax=Flexithrix dorotheae TaxID=70993 RepID=UPI000366E338|nr:antibiotic biosynthesis monooxygenase [Flexithrix dorotheae]